LIRLLRELSGTSGAVAVESLHFQSLVTFSHVVFLAGVKAPMSDIVTEVACEPGTVA
jgi:hypothetical protein